MIRDPTLTITNSSNVTTSSNRVLGVDFAGPILYKRTTKETGKAHIALFTCSSTRAVHLRLTPDLSASEFIKR